MQIVCPNCATSYQVEPSSVGPTGRSVRCARCRTVWFAADTAALSEIAASHRAEMAQFATTGAGDAAEPAPVPAAYWMDEAVAVTSEPEPEPEPQPEPEPAEIAFVEDAPPLAAADSAISVDPPASSETAETPLIESPALAPIDAASEPSQREDIETMAARRALEQARNRRFRWPLPAWPTAILALLLLDVGLIGWRANVVRVAPQTASLYAAIGLGVNLRGLVLNDVTTETLSKDGVRVLLVQGRIVSTAAHTVEVPRLRFAVRNGGGNEIYSWTALPNRSLLVPGDTLAFESRLASPPPETHDVLVRFFNRRDLGVGIQ
jgi:predicted Zn finger-like uncharacterized protein